MSLFTRSQSTAGTASRPDDPALEAAVQRLGGALIDRARQRRGGLLSAGFWSDKLMDWAMRDEAFKTQLFRFVDAFPTLGTAQEVHDHLADALSQPGVTLPPGLGMGLKAGGIFKGAMTKTITARITGMAEKFIAGSDATSALPVLERLWNKGVAFSVDLLGEACVSQSEAEIYRARYLDLINTLANVTRSWPANPSLERDHLGPIPRTNVSIKLSSLMPEADPVDADGTIDALMSALAPILEAARERQVLINFDMEQSELKDLTLELFMRCCTTFDFHAGLAMQAYLRSGDDDARRVIQWAKQSGRCVTVRLVKGAYWDYEAIHAEEMGWPVPVWARKVETDACFERMTRLFIEEGLPADGESGGVRLALGSHNARSIAYALALLEKHGLPSSAVELQMLYGMAEELKLAAVEQGLRLREYVPVGEMIPGMAYLVRRLLENTSNESWLRAGFAEDVPNARLLASPHPAAEDDTPATPHAAAERHALSPADERVGDGRPFHNEPLRDFSDRAVQRGFADAVKDVHVATVASADPATIEHALEGAAAAREAWGRTPVVERAALLTRAAALMRGRRDTLSATLVVAADKVWRAADAEVCDAIDACEYYARQAVALCEPQRLGAFIGELNHVLHEPRGVAVVLASGAVPFAGPAGVVTAALATGNTVIVRSHPRRASVVQLLIDVLEQAGAPPGVLHHLAGPDAEIDRTLVADMRVHLVAGLSAFGEHEVDVVELARQQPAEQHHRKKLIIERVGKNGVIVDTSAHLDEAVLGVRQSAFGGGGQSPSACSRAIVLAPAYETFLERLCESTRGFRLGDPRHPGVDLGPVLDRRPIDEWIAKGKTQGRLVHEGSLPDASELLAGRDYVAPHVFADIPPTSEFATLPLIGPLLAVFKVETFEDALAIANLPAFKRVGSVYTRRPAHIERARLAFRVGTLFINRPTTGGRIGRQPTGGIGLAGDGMPAGGHDYLRHFVVPRTICENTMRQGFAG